MHIIAIQLCIADKLVPFAGAIPIPGAKNLDQLRDHLGALDCNLDMNEVAVIDERLDAAK